jgi:hypothetical protein
MFLVENEYDLAIREAEWSWIRDLLGQLQSGGFPEIAMWRSFHTTGEIPPELQDLLDRGNPEK